MNRSVAEPPAGAPTFLPALPSSPSKGRQECLRSTRMAPARQSAIVEASNEPEHRSPDRQVADRDQTRDRTLADPEIGVPIAGFMTPALLALLLAVFTPPAQSGTDVADTFDTANRLYEKGRYREAIETYQRLGTNTPFAALHFNLGNAFYRSGQTGQAIAEYHRAAALAPRDREVMANLRYVRDTVTGPTWTPHWTETLVQRLTSREWRMAAGATVWLCFALLVAGQLKAAWRTALRRPVLLSALLAAGVVAATLWNDLGLGARRFVVVIEPDTVVRLGPFEGSAESMQLKDGAELLVVDEKDDWLQVTADGRASGWLRAAATRPLSW